MNEQQTQDDWTTCPPGTFGRMRQDLPAVAKQRTVQPYATGIMIAAVAAAMLFGFSLLRGTGEVNSNGVTPAVASMQCDECFPLLPDYVAEIVDDVTTERMKEHLSYCAVCQDRYKELTGKPYSARQASTPAGKATIATMFVHQR